MKKIFFTFIILLFWAVFAFFWWSKNPHILSENFFTQNTVSVVVERWWENFSRGTGWKINENTVITAWHVVKIFDGEIFIENEKFFLKDVDAERDIAYLVKNFHLPAEEIFFQKAEVGEKIFAYVFRDGKIVKKEWKIFDNNAEIIAYSLDGKIQKLSGKILTDIDFEVGDSGAMLWNDKNLPVGMVHISQK